MIAAAVEPDRVGRPDPRRPRASATRCAPRRHPVVGALRHRRRRPRARHGPPGARRSAASRSRPPASPSTTAPARPAGVLDGWLVDTVDAGLVDAGRGRGHRLPRRAADDDRPRRDRRHGARAAVALVRPMSRLAGSRCSRPTGSARSPRATTWSPWSPPRPRPRRRRRRRGHQQDRQQGRGSYDAAARARTCSPARPSGWSPAAARPRIVREPPRPGDGRGRHRRLQRRGRPRGAAPPRPRRAAHGRCATGLLARTGRNVAVLVTDTAGRAWRQGQTDLAIGAAGFVVLDDHAGRVDGYGNPLAVTAPALADELAGAADLAKGKLAGRPVAVVRGLAAQVLPRRRRRPRRPQPEPAARRGHVRARRPRGRGRRARRGAGRGVRHARHRRGDLVAALARVGRHGRDGPDGDRGPARRERTAPAAPAAVAHAHGWVDSDRDMSPPYSNHTFRRQPASWPSPKNVERKAKIEQMRREQQRKERRRSLAILGACGVVVVALLGRRDHPVRQATARGRQAQEHRADQDRRLGGGRGLLADQEGDRDGSGQHITPPTADQVRRRSPGVRQALGQLPHRFRDPHVLHRLRPSRDRARSCTASSTATRSSGTTTRSPKGSGDYKALEQIADKLGTDSYVMAAPWTTKDGGRSRPASTSRSRTGPAPTKQKGVWQYCAKASGAGRRRRSSRTTRRTTRRSPAPRSRSDLAATALAEQVDHGLDVLGTLGASHQQRVAGVDDDHVLEPEHGDHAVAGRYDEAGAVAAPPPAPGRPAPACPSVAAGSRSASEREVADVVPAERRRAPSPPRRRRRPARRRRGRSRSSPAPASAPRSTSGRPRSRAARRRARGGARRAGRAARVARATNMPAFQR